MRILDVLLALLYPPQCALCGRELTRPGNARLCRGCLSGLHRGGGTCVRCGDLLGSRPEHPAALCRRCAESPPAFRQARACLIYRESNRREGKASDLERARPGRATGSVAREAILRWKYHSDHVLGAALARYLAEMSPYRGSRYDLVVPVPLHRSRLARRGFNQAAVLARASSRGVGKFAPGVLRRMAATPSQTSLDRAARRANVGSGFMVGRPDLVQGRSVLVVDDVLTSGATVHACAAVLMEAGAVLVDVLTLARVTTTIQPEPANHESTVAVGWAGEPAGELGGASRDRR